MTPQTRYALKRRFYQTVRRRRGVSVRECAAAKGWSTSTWHRRAKKAAEGDTDAHNAVLRSIELAHTPPLQDTPRACDRERG